MKNGLRAIIRELVLEQIITEKFGEKIGLQPSAVGVCDERDDDDIEEVAPPGREDQVKALKKQPGIDNPWAVAWASYNKSHKK